MKSSKMFMQLWLTLLLLVSTSATGWCAQDPFRLGQVTDEELNMKVYAKDTSAAAVVLYDYGHSSFQFSRGTQLQFKRTVRIKILNKKGLEYANIEIPYYKSKKGTETIINLKGFSYNLEGGKITQVELEESAIFDEKQDANLSLKKLVMPNVKEGTVLEYTYTIRSDFFQNLRSWEFQKTIPVLWSEYHVDMVPFFDYKNVLHGSFPFHVKDTKVEKQTAYIVWQIDTPVGRAEQSGTMHMDVVKYRWVMKDVPAFKEEPYLANATDYISKIEFELSKIQYPKEKPVFTIDNWDEFTKELLKEDDFGKQLTSAPYLQKAVEAVTAGKTDTLEKAKAILKFVQANMQWDGKNRIYAENIKKAFDKHSGSSAEINLLLTALLREAKVDAHPMLISTREHGQPFTESPMLSKFNYVLSYVRIEGKEYLVDATERGLPLGMLPLRCLNGKGWVVEAPSGKWLPLQSLDRNAQAFSATMEIKPTGQVLGSVEENYLGVPAMRMRSKIQEQGKESFVKSYTNAGTDWTRQEIDIQNLDKMEELLKTKYQLIGTGDDQQQDLLYVSSMLTLARQDNPFVLETRLYPIDFASPQEEIYTFSYALPEGYEVETLPEPALLSLPGNTVKFSYMVQLVGGQLQVMSKLNINKAVFSAEEYSNLRELYTRMVAKHAEKVVLRKKS